jgi:hypothetical protein
METLKISMDLDNAALREPDAGEDAFPDGHAVAGVLRDLARRLDDYGVRVGDSGKLTDDNGLTVGDWMVSADSGRA